MAVASRLPGIDFDVVSPPSDEALVRMDIAAFVGFAASGPLQLPVAVEDTAHFEEVFGNDLAIATDALKQPVYACLASAVRAFLRNGGRRCWVVRVAGEGAVANQFAVPGLFKVHGAATAQAYAVARSEGSWSDGLSAGASLRSLPIEVLSVSMEFPSAADPGIVSVDLSLDTSDDVVPGDLLRLTFPETNELLWLFIDTVKSLEHPSPPVSGAKPGQLIVAAGATSRWEALSSPPSTLTPVNANSLPRCERVTMDLFVQSDDGQSWSTTNLGFAPPHPRYWANLPDDATAYSTSTLTGPGVDALHPRFPLAGLDDQAFYIPSGVSALPSFVPMTAPTANATDRNGLATFGPELFLDSGLVDTTTLDLLSQAYYIQYQSSDPRPLTGIHAVLGIDEVTIVAVPDAVQRGWLVGGEDPLLSPPVSSPLQHPEWWHFLDCRSGQTIPRVSTPPLGNFQPCDLLLVAAPPIELTSVLDGSFSIVWTAMAGATDFLEEAVDPGFATAAVIYQGSSGVYTVHGRSAGDYYYRLRRQIGSSFSDYSNGLGLRIESVAGYQEVSESAYSDDTLFAVHQSLLRMCAARGDLFAVLALPAHYRDRDAISHAAKLQAFPGGAEPAALSFGGLYHPWLTGREEDDLLNLRDVPPDGAISGIMAKRSWSRGPWISPANEPLHGVVDLTPPIDRTVRQQLQDAQVNLIRQAPGAFLCLSALTLSDDDDLLPINVRRLLSFLRKTAMKVGVDYVFEPNSPSFRRGVQRGFEKMLDGLLLRGAFAGRTAADSFQVVIDGSLNTSAAMDRGEFYVQLRVAPSLPMKFLTVRLLQSADRSLVTEGS